MDHAKLIDELVRDEGLQLKVYSDSMGIPTIGIGRNLRDVGISRQEAYHLLNNDIEVAEADLDYHLGWWRSLNETRQRVLVNMCFNMGITRLLKFRHMLEHMQAGNFGEAAVQMRNSVWYNQVGPRAARLEEAMRKGTFDVAVDP